MSRVAKVPIVVPPGVEVEISGQGVTVKGSMGTLDHTVHERVSVVRENGELRCVARDEEIASIALAGTTRAHLANMVNGVAKGFERRLTLVGVGYRAQMQGANLNLSLGYSHPIEFPVPEGVTIETPSQTEVVVRGIDKQQIGQVAATIRGFRPPEPYKGKGVKYSDEVVLRKEAKKK